MQNLNLKCLDQAFRSSLKTHFSEETLILKLVEKIEQIPNYETLKFNPFLVEFLCRCIESATIDNKLVLDKQALLMNAYGKLYDLDDKDKVIVIHIIEYIHGNNLIKPASIAIVKFVKAILAKFGTKLVSLAIDKA